ncbi:TIGR03086 family metal-binding protein [Actinokineospora globicatena]|uniref:TIGR03086 family protein n=1 Tax=Actinokineospora globicatena TaxID=103729 RepID=A0A9W6QS53_9PSEU|nr:TIGR03086 family metal-binding protein [Actinokineospora globicatena]GLW93622.1 TIGR03086 family protein [Actinokineospora globicatena]
MSKSLMSRATDSVVALAAAVTPDQFDRPTPCPEWTVRDLVNHLTLWSGVVAERVARKLPAPTDGSEDESIDFAGQWPARFVDGATRAARAWDEPGALDGETSMMSSPRPATFFHDMLLAELVLHGWDLATATGQPFVVDDDVAARARDSTAAMAEQGREYGVFGPEVPTAPDASPLAQALGISGRDPGTNH